MKTLNIVALLLGAIIITSCIKNLEEPQRTIVLSAPEDNAAFDLAAASDITFNWSMLDDVDKYKIAFSLNDDMIPAATVDAVSSPHTVPAADIDEALNTLGMDYEATNSVYWSVRASPMLLNIDTQVRTLIMTRKPFVAVRVTGVTISSPTGPQTLDIGDAFTATATVQPANATNKAVTWSSNNTGVATVGQTTGLVTAVSAGAATITVTTDDGGHTATVAVTVQASPEAQAAAALAAALENATAVGATVTLTGDVSITDVTVPAGVTLVVPGGMTLTVTGTLAGAGTITVEGIVDAANSTFSGTANLADGSKSRGVVTKPADAYSGWVWTFYGRTWSDRINVPACDKSDFTWSTTTASCRSATADNALHYYYNWKYVDDNKTTMCPSGWRVPTKADIETFPLYVESEGDYLLSIWGKVGWFQDWGHSNVNAMSMYWTSTENTAATAWVLFVTPNSGLGGWGIDNGAPDKEYGIGVRCVRD
jgi:hypothetical protein